MHHLWSFSLSLVFSKCFSHSSLQRHARACNMSLTSANFLKVQSNYLGAVRMLLVQPTYHASTDCLPLHARTRRVASLTKLYTTESRRKGAASFK